ncbi:hypothetical protein NDU88_010627 [Pleurodeles waltl]|uniref:Uncharacterized protein n=1 Tax=Pleurodeles waltl TaxID=8319 RepID=A0AAV7QUY5_PLEWA|nr:hypothetical protein NDU88_010627 [Pleurodeles waltl]
MGVLPYRMLGLLTSKHSFAPALQGSDLCKEIILRSPSQARRRSSNDVRGMETIRTSTSYQTWHLLTGGSCRQQEKREAITDSEKPVSDLPHKK